MITDNAPRLARTAVLLLMCCSCAGARSVGPQDGSAEPAPLDLSVWDAVAGPDSDSDLHPNQDLPIAPADGPSPDRPPSAPDVSLPDQAPLPPDVSLPPDIVPPPPDAMPSCSYACVADPTTANSTCSGPIVSQMMGSGQAVFQVDLTGFSQLYLALTICDPTDWVLNIGNSPSNNGAGGDAAQFSNDSELQIQNTTFAVYGNQNASTPLLLTDPAFIPGAGCVNRGIIVADSLVETLSPPHTVTSPYVFRINQPDTEGQPDALFYVGLNRVVSIGSPRTGSGVSLASFCLK